MYVQCQSHVRTRTDADKTPLQGKYTVTLIEGDGIGPEISQSVKDIFSAANVRGHSSKARLACKLTPIRFLSNGSPSMLPHN